MKYKEYLQTDHWREFRKKILEERDRCQNCSSKENLQVHHRNYDCLWEETSDDVMVFCKDCHYRFHDKKKWKKKMKKSEDLGFTIKKEKYRKNNDYYNIESPIERKCRRCGKKHNIFYKECKNGKRLAMVCPESKPRTDFLPFEDDLDIPTIKK